MHTRRFLLSSITYLVVYGVQIAVVDQIHFPFGGFSLFLIFVLSWAALSSPEVGAVAGFGAGIFLDIDPSSTGPFGQWMLVLSGVGFGIAFLRYGDGGLRDSPLSLIVLVAAGVMVSVTAYVLLSFLFGHDLGNAAQLGRTILGNGLWSLAITPFILPIASRLHRAVFETREM